MDTITDDQMEASVPDIIAPGLHRSENPNKRVGASKADSRYWIQGKRLALHDSANYSIQLYKQGQRCWFPLGTPNKKAAAAKAVEIYSFIQAHGWNAALERFKSKPSGDEKSTATVGKLIATACGISSARRQSLDAYAKAFRRIVSETKGITHDRKYDAIGGGSAEWRQKVDAVELHTITPADVVAWKNLRLRQSETDPLAKRRAIVTVNSLIRNAKSLFGKKILPFVEQAITIPRPLPFDGGAFSFPLNC